MKDINHLIKKLCPNGIKYKKLEDCLDYEQPTKYIVKSTEYDDSYKTPVLTAGQSFIIGYTGEIDGIYKADSKNPVIIFDDFTTGFHWVDFDFKVKSSAMKMLRPKNNICFRYVFYAMSCIKFQASSHVRHWISVYSQFQIPIPPVEIQREITEILSTQDKLIELKQNLIDQKKQQKKWLMQNLLTGKIRLKGFKGEWEKVKLEEIFSSINSGKSVKNEENGIYSIYGSTGEIGKANSYDYDENIIIVARVGANAGSLYKIYNKCKISDNALLIRINEKNSFLFIFYLLCQINLRNLVYGSGQPLITSGHIKKILTCIPLIEEQTAIVEILSVQDREIELLEKELEQEKLKKKFLMNLLLSGK